MLAHVDTPAGLVGAAAQQGDLTQLMLEAHMDRTLTEVPKSLGDLYQQSRAALQRILHTEARLLHGTDPAGGTEDRSMEIGRNSAASGTQGAQLHMDDSCGRCGGTGGTQGGHDAEAGARAESPPGEAEVSGPEAAEMAVQEVAGGGAGVAACACGRPLLVGTSDGWLRVPTARHSRARRTVSGKNRCACRLVSAMIAASVRAHEGACSVFAFGVLTSICLYVCGLQ